MNTVSPLQRRPATGPVPVLTTYPSSCTPQSKCPLAIFYFLIREHKTQKTPVSSLLSCCRFPHRTTFAPKAAQRFTQIWNHPSLINIPSSQTTRPFSLSPWHVQYCLFYQFMFQECPKMEKSELEWAWTAQQPSRSPPTQRHRSSSLTKHCLISKPLSLENPTFITIKTPLSLSDGSLAHVP